MLTLTALSPRTTQDHRTVEEQTQSFTDVCLSERVGEREKERENEKSGSWKRAVYQQFPRSVA